jgi:ubiquinol-cytochrome c reductase cytochrome b subunit
MAMTRQDGWWESRLGAGSALRTVLDEDIPGGARFTYTLGSATILTFLTLAVTGIFQLFYYVPSTSQAYASVNFIRFQVPFGWLVHGLHFWAANLMVVLVAVHLAQTFIWGAFKKPRELTWLLGSLLLVFTLLAMFTGTPLAWDEKGFWVARVGANLAGSVPVIGELVRDKVFGAPTLGQLTLSRMFPLHIALIPIFILGIFGLHMVAFRRGGAAGTFNPSEKIGRFWPRQVIMDILVFSGLLTLMVWASAWMATPVTGAADAIDPTYVARPEWPFLWLFQLLKYLNGPLEWIGFLVVPLAGVLLLLLVPWLDRKPERSPAKRPLAMAIFVLALVGVGWLTWLGATQQPSPIAAPSGPPPATPDSAIESTPPAPGPSVASHTIGSAAHGQLIYDAYCIQCHGPEGKGGVDNPNSVDGTVPELNPIDPAISGADKSGHVADVQKFVDGLDEYLQNGSTPDATPTTSTPKLKMPSFGNTYALTQEQIANVEAYVMQLNGVQRVVIAYPGIDPKTYFWWVLGGFAVVAVVSGAALIVGPKR